MLCVVNVVIVDSIIASFSEFLISKILNYLLTDDSRLKHLGIDISQASKKVVFVFIVCKLIGVIVFVISLGQSNYRFLHCQNAEGSHLVFGCSDSF